MYGSGYGIGRLCVIEAAKRRDIRSSIFGYAAKKRRYDGGWKDMQTAWDSTNVGLYLGRPTYEGA